MKQKSAWRHLLLLCMCLISVPLFGDEQEPFINDAAFVVASHLPQRGQLRERNGYIYLKVVDAYINAIFPLLTQHDIEKPPYFRRPDSPGAHISVFDEDETKHMGIPPELGRIFSFTLMHFAKVKIDKHNALFILAVYAPELEALRRKYGFHPLLHGHEYHITVAIRT